MRYVYLIAAEHGLGNVKIGLSKDPHSRLRQLQTANADKLTIYKTWKCDSLQEARQVEKSAHILLSKYKTNGEWYDVSYDVAIEAVERVINKSSLVQEEEEKRQEKIRELKSQLAKVNEEGKILQENLRVARVHYEKCQQDYYDNVRKHSEIADQIKKLEF